MAGHNKWSKVKHIKARVDVIRGRVFSKCAHEIALAARAGGGDPSTNARLRTAIDNAKAVSTPKENIERAIKKGTGELGGTAIQEVTYEAYGPSGTAFIIEMATDNINRTAQDMRTIFTKNNGSVATPGSVSYQFNRKGEIRLAADAVAADRIMDVAIEVGADDVQSDESEHILYTAPNELGTVANALRIAGLPPVSEKLVSIAQNPAVVSDLETAKQILRLYDILDDYADTVNVFTNFEVADDVLEQLGD
ncbi:YebC/PmpR family DNA-binding transcriptional regulator [Luteolibacter ambystomatis]|uniref:Probable transcriptional regulatory protein KBB96_01280 n=1 Tax=Luteolibacter ambystomatis TaxID=2824561 RepID=A0A975IZR7_9BACT|nr:YebC/PmpR family DNA-binding transcriptional regulator [Luteolibacter ambystomatis]QUE51539.1 YebC/PmpR family DNA-binding transcriptional regulator [Luteolibacter ambystomatis]